MNPTDRMTNGCVGGPQRPDSRRQWTFLQQGHNSSRNLARVIAKHGGGVGEHNDGRLRLWQQHHRSAVRRDRASVPQRPNASGRSFAPAHGTAEPVGLCRAAVDSARDWGVRSCGPTQGGSAQSGPGRWRTEIAATTGSLNRRLGEVLLHGRINVDCSVVNTLHDGGGGVAQRDDDDHRETRNKVPRHAVFNKAVHLGHAGRGRGQQAEKECRNSLRRTPRSKARHPAHSGRTVCAGKGGCQREGRASRAPHACSQQCCGRQTFGTYS